MRLLRGVVYMMNSKGPKTEPCGTPQEAENEEDLKPEAATMDVRDRRYERNQDRATSVMPNQVAKRWSRIVWSIVSKAADRSSKHRQDTCCLAVA